MPGNYVDRYKEYREVVTAIGETEELLWSEIVAELENGGFFQILRKGVDCDLILFERFELML